MRHDPSYPNLYLIGPMAAGKTTLRQLLAAQFNKLSYDLDREIEKQTQRTISSIFAQEGESSFRLYEYKALQRFSSFSNIILSTGGGTVLLQANRDLVSKTGLVIYLSVSIEEQYRRITQHKQHRPLFNLQDGRASLASLMQKRQPFYEAIADFCYDTESHSLAGLAQHIMTDIAHIF